MTIFATKEATVSKSTFTALAVALALAAPAYAQTTTAPRDSTQPMRQNTTFTTQSGQLRAGEMIGSTVYDVHNRDIGSVKDIVLDRDGKVAGVVVDVGSFLGVGGKYVAVALNDIKMDNNRLTLDRTKEQLQSAQAYPLDNNSNSSNNSNKNTNK